MVTKLPPISILLFGLFKVLYPDLNFSQLFAVAYLR